MSNERDEKLGELAEKLDDAVGLDSPLARTILRQAVRSAPENEVKREPAN